mmetsp:Transcript_38542/g.53675  ORF Transcript_38542/g.53675 Transcript_38542/m.53675 type:complete len:513 (-) Transcript_38542:26-1564(-)
MATGEEFSFDDEVGEELSKLLQPELTKKRVTLLLLGSTGHGKSSFGNYLYNLCLRREKCSAKFWRRVTPIEGKEKIFETAPVGVLCEPCTKKCLIEEWCVGNLTVRIADTPGLNEKDKHNDLENMKNVFGILQELGEVNCVLYCQTWDQKADKQTEETLKYYRLLLGPLFDVSQVLCVMTKFKNDDYSELDGRLEAITENARTRLSTAFFGEKRQKTENIAMVEFINSTPPKAKYLRGFAKGKWKNSMATRSFLVRNRILKLVSKFDPVRIVDHLFPLPHRWNESRHQVLLNTKKLRKEIEKTLEIAKSVKHARVKQRSSLLEVKEDFMRKIQTCDQLLQEARKIVHLCDSYRHGDEMLVLRKQFDPPRVSMPCTFANVLQKDDSHNTTVSWDRLEGAEGFCATITPDVLNFSKRGNDRWFSRVYLEVSGTVCNSVKISQTLDTQAKYRMKFMETERQCERLDAELAEAGEEVRAIDDRIKDYGHAIELLGRESFTVKDIDEVIAVIEKHTK